MAFPVIAVAAIAAGSILSSYAKLQEGKAQAKALTADAESLRQQSSEVGTRAAINEEALKRLLSRELGGIQIAQGASGISGGSIGLSKIEDLTYDASVAAVNARRETHFQQEMQLRQARNLDKQSADVSKNSKTSAAAALLGGLGSMLGQGSK